MFFGGSIAEIGQIQQRANHPYRADPAKKTRRAPAVTTGQNPRMRDMGKRGYRQELPYCPKQKWRPLHAKGPPYGGP